MKKNGLIITGVIIAVILLIISTFVGVYNKAIGYEEQILESQSALNTQEKRREDLIYNLVDTVESYNNYEQEALTSVIEARNSAKSGDIDNAEVAITALTEAYPELKSNENYKELMNELSTTENLIANYRENLNIQIKNYNKICRKFPNNIILNMMGYEKIDVEYLEYETSEDAPTNLFENK